MNNCAEQMKTLAFFLVLPTFVLAGIEVEIIASDIDSQRHVRCGGSIIDIISDQEILTFKLTEENLKAAVKSYMGRKPDDVFLKSPTPWGDLYKTNQWQQVSSILKPVKGTILSDTFHHSSVLKQSFANRDPQPAVFNAKMWLRVQNIVSSYWERNGELSPSRSIDYNIDIKALAVTVDSTFSYFSKWGNNVVKFETVIIGSDMGFDVALQPDQAVEAELIATKRSMQIKIDYNATLIGSVAMNYANIHNGHHFWSVDINKVLESGRFNKTIPSSEVINVRFYSDAKIVIRDLDTNNIIKVMPLTVC